MMKLLWKAVKKRFSNEYISDMDYDYGAMLINLSKDVIDNSRLIINSSECGINGALWKLAEMSNCGFEVDYKAIPVKQSVVELSELLKLRHLQHAFLRLWNNLNG